MHSHEKTLLASLGFADPDKKCTRHDVACRYLCNEGIAKKIGLLAISGLRKSDRYNSSCLESEFSIEYQLKGEHSFRIESVISKGEGQYKTHIGFLDVGLRFPYVEKRAGRFRRCKGQIGDWGDWQPLNKEEQGILYVAAEVKIHPIPLGDMLRQIQLYREYILPPAEWILVTDFPLSASEVAALNREKIFHVRLGEEFDRFMNSEVNVSASESLTI